MGIEDARMTSVYRERERSGGIKISRELMNALSKTSIFMSIVLLDASIEIKKGGYIKVN